MVNPGFIWCDIMELLKNDYAPVTAKVKVYDKTYKRKNKQGKTITAKTVQNTITLPKEIPFKHNEDVIILSQENYDKLISAEKVQSNDNISEELESQLILIQEYKSRISSLEEEIHNRNVKMDTFNDTINNLSEDLRNANHSKDIANAELNDARIKISMLEEKMDKNKDIIKILTSYYESILNETMNISTNRLINEINNELKKTSIFQRLKGLTITSEPNINKKEITEEAIAKLNNVIIDNKLLE